MSAASAVSASPRILICTPTTTLLTKLACSPKTKNVRAQMHSPHNRLLRRGPGRSPCNCLPRSRPARLRHRPEPIEDVAPSIPRHRNTHPGRPLRILHRRLRQQSPQPRHPRKQRRRNLPDARRRPIHCRSKKDLWPQRLVVYSRDAGIHAITAKVQGAGGEPDVSGELYDNPIPGRVQRIQSSYGTILRYPTPGAGTLRRQSRRLADRVRENESDPEYAWGKEADITTDVHLCAREGDGRKDVKAGTLRWPGDAGGEVG